MKIFKIYLVSANSSGIQQQSQHIQQSQQLQTPQQQHIQINTSQHSQLQQQSNSVSVVTTSHNISLPSISIASTMSNNIQNTSHIHQVSQHNQMHQQQIPHSHEIIQREHVTVPVTIISHSGEINNLQLHSIPQPEEHSVVY